MGNQGLRRRPEETGNNIKGKRRCVVFAYLSAVKSSRVRVRVYIGSRANVNAGALSRHRYWIRVAERREAAVCEASKKVSPAPNEDVVSTPRSMASSKDLCGVPLYRSATARAC